MPTKKLERVASLLLDLPADRGRAPEMMNTNRDVSIEVINRHGHVSSRMEEYAIRKAEHFLKFDARISRVEIVVDGPHTEPSVELIVHVDRAAQVIAKDQAEHFNAAVDGAVEKIERQLKKAKEKRTHHRGDGGGLRDTNDNGDLGEPEETYDDVVRRNLDS